MTFNLLITFLGNYPKNKVICNAHKDLWTRMFIVVLFIVTKILATT